MDYLWDWNGDGGVGGRAPGQVRDVAGAVADGALGRGGAGSRGEVGQRDEGRGGDGDDDGSLHLGRPGGRGRWRRSTPLCLKVESELKNLVMLYDYDLVTR